MATETPAADDILAEVFQQLEKNGNFELNFNQLLRPGFVSSISSSAVESPQSTSEKSKTKSSSSSKHKKKHSKKKSGKRKKTIREDDATTATATLLTKHSIESIKDNLSKESLLKTANKNKKSKRTHYSSEKYAKPSSSLSPSRKKHKHEQNIKKTSTVPMNSAEILNEKDDEGEEGRKKSSVEKRTEEMYEEYERTMNSNSDHSGIKAVSLEDYLKSKGYLVKENDAKNISTSKDLRKQNPDSKHSSSSKTPSSSSARSFIPRNLKVKMTSTVPNEMEMSIGSPSSKVVMENISEDEEPVSKSNVHVDDVASENQSEKPSADVEIGSNLSDSGNQDVQGNGKFDENISGSIDKENMKNSQPEINLPKMYENFVIKTFKVSETESKENHTDKTLDYILSSVGLDENDEDRTSNVPENVQPSVETGENDEIQTSYVPPSMVKSYENFVIRTIKVSKSVPVLSLAEHNEAQTSVGSNENDETVTNKVTEIVTSSVEAEENIKIRKKKVSENIPSSVGSDEKFEIQTNKVQEIIARLVKSDETQGNKFTEAIRLEENCKIQKKVTESKPSSVVVNKNQINKVPEITSSSIRSDENFEQLISKPIPKSIVINILTEKTKTLLSACPTTTSPSIRVNSTEDGELVQSDFSSINSPDAIDVEDETDGEVKDDGDERSKKKEKKRKKHHKSEKHKKKSKKSKTSSSSQKLNDDVSQELAARFGGASSFFDDRRVDERETIHQTSSSAYDRHSNSPRPSSSFDRSRYSSVSRESQLSSRSYWNRRRQMDFARRRSPIDDRRHYRRSRARSSRGDDDDDDEKEINKKRLYDIARRNASAMLQQGTLQQVYNMSAQEIAKLKAGGKSVDELTDYCRKLQKKEDRFNHNSDSSSDESVRQSADDNDIVFRHPFALNPPKNITFNVRNLTQIPIKTPAERAADDKTLKITFPVSSGQQHRVKEDEWVPVTPSVPFTDQSLPNTTTKKVKSITLPQTLAIEPAPTPSEILPLPPPPMPPPIDERNRVFIEQSNELSVDIGEVVASRLTAIRRLYDNPNDIEALKMMHFAEENMKRWAESKNVPGAFIGGTGAICLTPDQLGPRDPKFQAWARKDQLSSCKPVESRVGMSLLQKMGWKPGEGLGKNKEGSLTPLLLDVKNDRKGLVADDELNAGKMRLSASAATCKDFQGKHPVSVLMELCAKRRWNPPSFSCVENGPSHNRRFLWKVVVNGVEYQPAVPSNNKKTGKAQACQVVLQSLGMVPRDQALPVVIG